MLTFPRPRTGVTPAAAYKLSQPGGDPCQQLQRVPGRNPISAARLCPAVGTLSDLLQKLSKVVYLWQQRATLHCSLLLPFLASVRLFTKSRMGKRFTQSSGKTGLSQAGMQPFLPVFCLYIFCQRVLLIWVFVNRPSAAQCGQKLEDLILMQIKNVCFGATQ